MRKSTEKFSPSVLTDQCFAGSPTVLFNNILSSLYTIPLPPTPDVVTQSLSPVKLDDPQCKTWD